MLFFDDLPGEVVLSVFFLVCDDLKLHSSSLFNEFFLDQSDVMKVIMILCFLPLKSCKPSFENLEDALITNAVVKRRLEACDGSCSKGFDALSSFVMKHCSDFLSSAICILFNSIVS